MGCALSSLLVIVVALSGLLCCFGSVFIIFIAFGFILLRRRGKKKITAKEAVSAAAEQVSQVFVRGQGGLSALDDEEDEDED